MIQLNLSLLASPINGKTWLQLGRSGSLTSPLVNILSSFSLWYALSELYFRRWLALSLGVRVVFEYESQNRKGIGYKAIDCSTAH